jgi:drug/metabolite transporter (DMT)-like permease
MLISFEIYNYNKDILLFMLGFLLALASAFSEATMNLFSKKAMKKIDEYAVVWYAKVFSLPFLFLTLFFIQIPRFTIWFLLIVVAGALTNLVSLILYMKAIKSSPLSLTTPMLALTPLFSMSLAPFIFGEVPGFAGVLGVVLIAFGVYVLNLGKFEGDVLKPFKLLLKESGVLIMLVAALIMGISGVVDKFAVQNYNLFFYLFVITAFNSVVMTVIVLVKNARLWKKSMTLKSIVPIGMFNALTMIFIFNAFGLIFLAYAISIKRFSIIFSIIYGFYFFKEKKIKQRLAGALIMIFGAFLIAIS